MPISVTCSCGKWFEVPEHFAGRSGSCTQCGAPLQIPHAGAPGAGVAPMSDDQGAAFGGGGGYGAHGGGYGGGAASGHATVSTPSGGSAPPVVPTSAPSAPPGMVAYTPPAPGQPPGAPAGGKGVTIGRTVGSYRISHKLGDKKSSVFFAEARDGSRVALKVLPHQIIQRSPTVGKRFLREARSVFGLKHDNVVSCLDTGEELGTFFLAMEFFPGVSLQEMLDQAGGKLPEGEAAAILSRAAAGLGHLHKHKLLHRNVKPDHILVDPDGRVKLIGMGLVRSEEDDGGGLTMQGMLVGTPQAMSPEQANGRELDARADLWSLGITMYRALTGEVPFDHKAPMRILKMIVTEPIPDVRDKAPEVTERCAQIVDRLLQRDPDTRFQTADEVIAALRDVQAAKITAPPASAVPKLPPAPPSGSAHLAAAPSPPPASMAPPAPSGTHAAHAAPAPAAGWRNATMTLTRFNESTESFASRIADAVAGLDPRTEVVSTLHLDQDTVMVFIKTRLG